MYIILCMFGCFPPHKCSGTEGLIQSHLSQLFLPSLCSGLQWARGSPGCPPCRWTGKHRAPPPAPGHRGGTAAAPGPWASKRGHTERGRSRRRSAAGACTADRTSTWPLKNRVLIQTATCPKPKTCRGEGSSHRKQQS